MALADLQRALRDVLRDPSAPAPEPPTLAAYIDVVRRSAGLGVVREIIRSWGDFDAEHSCPLTTAALRAVGRWDAAAARFIADPPRSAYAERRATHFLALAAADEHPLVASVAAFERAYIAVTHGGSETTTVRWDRDPRATLVALANGVAPPPAERADAYVTVTSPILPHFFKVVAPGTAG